MPCLLAAQTAAPLTRWGTSTICPVSWRVAAVACSGVFRMRRGKGDASGRRVEWGCRVKRWRAARLGQSPRGCLQRVGSHARRVEKRMRAMKRMHAMAASKRFLVRCCTKCVRCMLPRWASHTLTFMYLNPVHGREGSTALSVHDAAFVAALCRWKHICLTPNMRINF